MSTNGPWWLRPTALDTRWMEHGLCRQVDPDLFFPENGANVSKYARRVCEACPVTSTCLDYALAHPGVTGMWGGTTERQRSRMMRERVSA